MIKYRSSEIVETLLEIIKRTLASGEDVLVSGFGRFSVKEKKERKGRNPATGDDMMLEPRKVVTFKRPGVVHMFCGPILIPISRPNSRPKRSTSIPML
ncbi:MAG: integration host factor subunit alpha [Desulfobacterales bacterium]|nr:integration host factor subunit alpha [Desulfobacterales bacterium]